MLGELVALDLETTGLNPDVDTIIEFGAVRIVDGVIVDEYTTLVNPGRPIPENIRLLTGIKDEDFLPKLRNPGEPPAPPIPKINEAIPAIRAFIGNATVIGHNVGFDLGFLARQGILQTNLWVDTYDLASVLLPRSPRYNLATLASQMHVDLEEAHRALHDARASALLYWALWKKALTLPYSTIHEIVASAQGLDWNATPFFDAVLQEQRSQGKQQPARDLAQPTAASHVSKQHTALEPNSDPHPLDLSAINDIMLEGGNLSQSLPTYETRHEQVEMAHKVTDAFNDSKQMMIEAGAGTGKTLAYLIPAALWATQNQERVVISTNTINLQEQLIHNDIPVVRSVLNTDLSAAVLKGRGNYLCPRRLIAMRRRHPGNVDELRTLAKILVWMLESNSGDRNEINLRGPIENNVWQRLSAEDENCALNRCETAMQGACPFYEARKAAETAHIVIVNHALLISDAMLSNKPVIPEYERVIIDEAHNLEEAITHGLNFRIDEIALRRRLNDLGNLKRGILGDILAQTGTVLTADDFNQLNMFVKHISTAIKAMDVHLTSLFERMHIFFDQLSNARPGDTSIQLRITAELRSKATFAPIGETWGILEEFFDVVATAMQRVTHGLERTGQRTSPELEDLINSSRSTARFMEQAKNELTKAIRGSTENNIYWLNYGQSGHIALQSAPLNIREPIRDYLWNKKKTVVLTSATLRTDTGFDYLTHRLNTSNFDTAEVGSPFDYPNSTLLYLPDDLPDPSDRGRYQQSVERGIIELAAALNGRVLALFTSYTQLRQTAQAISPRLSLGNITVYDQLDSGNRHGLVESFKLDERAVLLGTRSFWEGVDLPGDTLSGLVLTRLPFAVPTDPIFAARSEQFGDSFKEYALPEAILRFRQGFGRLIRTKQDRGVVVVLDGRLLSKSYGSRFLDALPDCTVQRGPLELLPEAARKWMSRSETSQP